MAKYKYEWEGWKNCEHCQHIVGDDGAIVKNPWQIDNSVYRITGTETDDATDNQFFGLEKVLNVIDTILVTEQGGQKKILKIRRKQLYLRTRKNKIEFKKLQL